MRLYELALLALVLTLPYCQSQDDKIDSIDDDQDEDVLTPESIKEGETEDIKKNKDNFVPLGEDEPVYKEPKLSSPQYLADSFPSFEDFTKNWIISKVVKDDLPKYNGEWKLQGPKKEIIHNDLGLVLTTPAKHYGISRRLDNKFKFNGDRFIIQYDVKFQEGQECGGAYVKLLSDETSFTSEKLNDDTPYTIMFGPDKCGQDSKLHFIIRYKNPKTGVYEEKHAAQPKTNKNLDTYFNDKKTHLYTLVINSDNTYEISVDREVVMEGSLLKDMTPAINPPKEIEDKNDVKPQDWDERAKIADPEAVKPEEWDETQPKKILDSTATMPTDWLLEEEPLISDSEAVKPEDWDEDMDGEWEAKMIDNPKCVGLSGCGEWKMPEIANPLYKGQWKAPLIDNVDYKGKWLPQMIENPDFYEDLDPFTSLNGIQAVAFELWSMSGLIMFDDIIISDDKEQVDEYTKLTWNIKREQEMKTSAYYGMSVYDAMKPYAWSILGIAVGIIAIIVYLCLPKKTKKAQDPKKTDAIQEDDEEEERDDSSVQEEQDESSKSKIEEINEEEVKESENVTKKSDENAVNNSPEMNETGDNSQARQRKVKREDLNEKIEVKSRSRSNSVDLSKAKANSKRISRD